MTTEELRACCEKSERFVLVVKRDREPRGEKVRLLPGLTGRLVDSRALPDGRVQLGVMVESADVRRFLERNPE